MEEQEERKMSTKEFWIRFGIWITFAVVVPFVYVAIAYGIFENVDAGRKISGWGIIAVIFACIAVMVVLNEAKKGLSYGNMIRQCIDGYSALIWILGALLVVNTVKNNAAEFEKFLIVVFISEAIAVPINPMRKWAEQHNIERGENFWKRTIRRALGKDD